MIRVDVEGQPAPKGSRMAGKSKTGVAYTYPASKYEAPWIKTVARATELVMRHRAPLEPPYYVDLSFRMRMPEKKNRGRMREWPASKDLDKLARAVIDGLVKGGLLEDDAHVIEVHATKRWAHDGEAPGVGVFAASVSQEAYAAA